MSDARAQGVKNKEKRNWSMPHSSFRVFPLNKRKSESLDTDLWLGLDSAEQLQIRRREKSG